MRQSREDKGEVGRRDVSAYVESRKNKKNKTKEVLLRGERSERMKCRSWWDEHVGFYFCEWSFKLPFISCSYVVIKWFPAQSYKIIKLHTRYYIILYFSLENRHSPDALHKNDNIQYNLKSIESNCHWMRGQFNQCNINNRCEDVLNYYGCNYIEKAQHSSKLQQKVE